MSIFKGKKQTKIYLLLSVITFLAEYKYSRVLTEHGRAVTDVGQRISKCGSDWMQVGRLTPLEPEVGGQCVTLQYIYLRRSLVLLL